MALSEVDIFREYALTQVDIQLGEPATEQEIADFEIKYGIKFPADVREFLLKINGLSIHGGFIAIDPLNEWGLVNEDRYFFAKKFEEMLSGAVDQYFHFGNYDISVWDWFIKLNADPIAETPVVVIYQEITKIAENFTDFLQKYCISNPESLLGL
jgi:hypothetical protein